MRISLKKTSGKPGASAGKTKNYAGAGNLGSSAKSDFDERLRDTVRQAVVNTSDPSGISEVNQIKINTLEDALDQLDAAERNLLEMQDESTFQAYKNLVRKAIGLIGKEAHRLKVIKDSSRREYEVVRVVNKNLQDLYVKVMSRNSNIRDVLQIMGEIRGLLIDLKV